MSNNHTVLEKCTIFQVKNSNEYLINSIKTMKQQPKDQWKCKIDKTFKTAFHSQIFNIENGKSKKKISKIEIESLRFRIV